MTNRKKRDIIEKKKYKPFDDSYFMNVHSWLNKPTTQPNDYNYLYVSKRNTWKIIIAESKEDYTELYSFVNHDDGKELFDQLVEEVKNESNRSESQDGESFYESALEYERERGYYLDYLHDASGRGTDGRSVSVFEKESSSEGERDSGRDNQNQGAESSVKKSRKANPHTSGKTTSPAEALTGQQRQTVANHARSKVYTRSEALEVVEQAARMLDETYGFDGGMGQVSGFVKLTQKVKGKAVRPFRAASPFSANPCCIFPQNML